MSKFSLYEVNDLLRQAIEQVDSLASADEGVIPDDWAKFLDDVQMERDTKALDVARYIKSLEVEAEAVGIEIDRLSARHSGLKKHASRLREYVTSILKPGEALKDANTTLGWRRSASVEIVDPDAIPDVYCKIVRTPSKEMIRQALKTGEVSGARISEKMNLQIK